MVFAKTVHSVQQNKDSDVVFTAVKYFFVNSITLIIYYNRSAVAEIGDRLATIDMGRKVVDCCASSNRLVTIHQRCRQTEHRSRSGGRTVTFNGRPKSQNSCVLLYWQRYSTALEQWASAKLCAILQGMELQNFRRGRYLYSAGRRPSRGHRLAF